MGIIEEADVAYDDLVNWATQKGEQLLAEKTIRLADGTFPLHRPSNISNLNTLLVLYYSPYTNWKGKSDGKLKSPVALLDKSGTLIRITTELDLRKYLEAVCLLYTSPSPRDS